MIDGVAAVIHRIAQDDAELSRKGVGDHGFALDQAGIAIACFFPWITPVDQNNVPTAPLQMWEEVDSAIARIKLLLMKPVWGTREEGFGDFAEFETWVQRGEPNPAPPGMSSALELYRYGSGG
jgi:hypothetical protein